MNSLAFFIRHDHRDAITETHSLSFINSFFIRSLFPCCLQCFGNDVRKTSQKPRHGSLSPFYIGLEISFECTSRPFKYDMETTKDLDCKTVQLKLLDGPLCFAMDGLFDTIIYLPFFKQKEY